MVLLIPALLLAVEAVPMPYTTHQIQVRNIPKCKPGVLEGSMACPFTLDSIQKSDLAAKSKPPPEPKPPAKPKSVKKPQAQASYKPSSHQIHVRNIPKCKPGVLEGSMACPFTADPIPPSELPVKSQPTESPPPPQSESPAKPKTVENTNLPQKPQAQANPKPPTKLDPFHDKLVLACGQDASSCQICQSPHAKCEAVQFRNDGDGPQVCLTRKDLLCAPLPQKIWDALPEDVD